MDKEQSIPDEIKNKIAERAKYVYEHAYASEIKIDAFIDGAKFGYPLNIGKWVKATDPPKKKGFYTIRGLNNQGNPVTHEGKDKIWFTGKTWLIREGCKVTEWLDETHPCQCTKYKEEVERLQSIISEQKQTISELLM